MVTLLDSDNLAPKGFREALEISLRCLPFAVDSNIPILVEKRNLQSDGLANNGAEQVGKDICMVIKLFAYDIDANVKYNRLNYWLLITLHEYAHVHFRSISPESVLFDMEQQCTDIAHIALQKYKNMV